VSASAYFGRKRLIVSDICTPLYGLGLVVSDVRR